MASYAGRSPPVNPVHIVRFTGEVDAAPPPDALHPVSARAATRPLATNSAVFLIELLSFGLYETKWCRVVDGSAPSVDATSSRTTFG